MAADEEKSTKKPAANKDEDAAPARTRTEDVELVVAKFGDALEHDDDAEPHIPMVRLKDPTRMLDVATFLQRDRNFEHLALITGIDRKGHLDVVYNFWSYSRNVPFGVRVRLEYDSPKLPSLTSLWATADWHERETYDLMGVTFEGHPHLRRILLPEGWRGHPLRKDYAWKDEQFVGLDPVTGEDVVYDESREGAW